MRIAFSGSRYGMTPTQRQEVEFFLRSSATPEDTLHHGLCLGADTEADEIARELGLKIWFHPSIKTDWTNRKLLNLTCEGIDPAYSYSGRNQRMVLRCDYLIATPRLMNMKGGTWNAIQHAQAAKKPHIVITPEGVIVHDAR